MKALCKNSVPREDATDTGDMSQRVKCGWVGTVTVDILEPGLDHLPCPRCSMLTLTPWIDVEFPAED